MREFKFIDLFAGIGGFRLALESLGAKCVFSAEIDPHAIQTYKENFNDDPTCDITKLDPKRIPDFDILCAGFPCQAFSISGKQKGFSDTTRGTLFFDICRILKEKQPTAFILENVQNLEKHDKGNTLFVMINSLNDLGYSVTYKVLNAKDFGVPQNRERIIIIGNKEHKVFSFKKLYKTPVISMYDMLDKDGDFEYLQAHEYTLLEPKFIKTQAKSGLIFTGYRNKTIRTNGTKDGTNHLSRVHKQPNRIYSSLGIHPTIASQEQSGRYFILVDGRVRKLTINECYRFMGFPDNFKKVGSKSKQYERIGNSICVPMIKEVASEMIKQFFIDDITENPETEFLEKTYKQAIALDFNNISLIDYQLDNVKIVVEKEESSKAVFTVLVSSLTYKCLHSEQDVRMHKTELKNGYSGRGFDTKFVTPFLKQKQFLGAMKESGWLTRSLEQAHPFTLDFPGKIQSSRLKDAFLQILNDVEVNGANPLEYLLALFNLSIKAKKDRAVEIINPITSENKLDIKDVMAILEKHFYYKYNSRGASILPVVALYSVYECMIMELKRFENKKLLEISSHYSSDKNSGNAGDIVVLNSDNSLYEVVEVKFDIEPSLIMLLDAYSKIKPTSIQRYYILSTKIANDAAVKQINDKIKEIRKEHGCQVIVNGLMQSLKYYLRLLSNTDLFIERYAKNLQKHPEINSEHKVSWNNIVNNMF
ncbi:DNA (cytosine-5-)-methyltransferase [Campylobacter jejuni]|uniref:DNA cytosine methyltransferase n=1 Tax=Campylobacter TaxID=194 RepID=UPI0002581EFA|nr:MULTISPECIES: DNA cytosine methyltransferase [Campylobacter]EAI5963343.1 DNA cytosine methyltransferase [Campylobacter coli]MBX1003591.1 DNA (cytosine-5-)-methyltransferase [Campylobacter jejuni]EAJ0742605.1 DNA cytosine methyltransferase [Campylobacter coli]EAK1882272.1 DNA cytosine methyltransferase [Campylobacter coli]EAK5532218.1 DNA cytosine methyltransferase [Campylobacter coli]